MLKAILFDLDGTLLPMNEEEFTKGYFGLLCKRLIPFGYDKDTLINTVWAGTKKMIKNSGEKTNEQVFWEEFANVYGEEKLKDKEKFDDFYLTDFKKTKAFCSKNEYAKKIVDYARSKGLKLILSSNPVFPRDGMVTRLNFVGLSECDFDYITSYENSHYSKPNPKYFAEILEKNSLRANEVILFGNSEKEDVLPASEIGIKGYLVGNVLLQGDAKKREITNYDDIISVIDSEIKKDI